MSNNKQSSVEWLEIEMEKLWIEKYLSPITMKPLIEKAKAMNKEQHRQTANVVRQAIFDLNYSSFDEYYNETYGGNNEQQ